MPPKGIGASTIPSTWWAVSVKEVKIMGVIAAIIVWAIIEAICGKNAGPLFVIVVLYLVISAIAGIIY